MPIPDFQTVLLPLLRFAGDEAEHSLRDAIQNLASHFELSEEERSVKIPSGYARLFDNRVGWARTHLIKAGLIESVRRAIFKITERGKSELNLNPEKLTVTYLKKYPEYLAMFSGTSTTAIPSGEIPIVESQATPDEIFAQSYSAIRKQLASDILERVKRLSTEPHKFEDLVVELLIRMGYGGDFKGSGETTQSTGDGGIDGIIKEDKLGLDVIYIQAKCHTTGSIGRPEVQSFAGAMEDRRRVVHKGVFITTTKFAQTAIDYAQSTTKRIVLIDGEQLAQLMIDHNLGVSVKETYELKEVDNDYFEG